MHRRSTLDVVAGVWPLRTATRKTGSLCISSGQTVEEQRNPGGIEEIRWTTLGISENPLTPLFRWCNDAHLLSHRLVIRGETEVEIRATGARRTSNQIGEAARLGRSRSAGWCSIRKGLGPAGHRTNPVGSAPGLDPRGSSESRRSRPPQTKRLLGVTECEGQLDRLGSSESRREREPNRRSDSAPVPGPRRSNQTGSRAGADRVSSRLSGRLETPETETARRASARRAVENYRVEQYT